MIDPRGESRAEAIDQRLGQLVEPAACLGGEREIEDNDATIQITRLRKLARCRKFEMRSHFSSRATRRRLAWQREHNL